MYNIWIGDKKLNKRWAVLKSEGDPGIQNKTDRRPIKFMIERRIDQSRSMVTTAEDKANDMIGQSKFREIFQELCSEQLFFSRSIRAAGESFLGVVQRQSILFLKSMSERVGSDIERL